MRSPVVGLAYSDVQAGRAVTSNQSGNRIGEACASSILGLIATGDASVESARRNGAITLIASVDETYQSYFIFYSKFCTVVRGR
ncbi:MAG: TRL-like family protein [Oligoflexia bacterium]|nr:TRL-like family protein [Oligoflexia bacterium]